MEVLGWALIRGWRLFEAGRFSFKILTIFSQTFSTSLFSISNKEQLISLHTEGGGGGGGGGAYSRLGVC